MRLTLLATFIAFAVPQSVAASEPKQPVPAEREVAETLRLVADLFKSDYEKAKTPADRTALAEKMFQQGLATNDDPTGQFVLLRVSKDIAAKAGDWELALKIVEEMLERFAFGTDSRARLEAEFGMKRDVLLASSRAVSSKTDRQDIGRQLANLGTVAVGAMCFEIAQQCFEQSLGLAQQDKEPVLAKISKSKLTRLKELAEEFAKLKPDFQTLQNRPTDPMANFNIGKFYCLQLGNWEQGISMLALGSDSVLKGLAIKELEMPSDAGQKLALADGWWEIAGQYEGDVAANIRTHAGIWYKQAIAGLKGLTQLKANKRIEEIQAGLGSSSGLFDLVPDITFENEPSGVAGKPTPASEARIAKMSAAIIGQFRMGSQDPVTNDRKWSTYRCDANGTMHDELAGQEVGKWQTDGKQILFKLNSDGATGMLLPTKQENTFTGVLTEKNGKRSALVAVTKVWIEMTFVQSGGGRPTQQITFWSNGKTTTTAIRGSDAKGPTYTFSNPRLTITWPDGSMDFCTMARDLNSYSGVNSNNQSSVSGKKVSFNPVIPPGKTPPK